MRHNSNENVYIINSFQRKIISENPSIWCNFLKFYDFLLVKTPIENVYINADNEAINSIPTTPTAPLAERLRARVG
jgi:hypothetical protein